MHIGNLPKKQLRKTIVKMIKGLRRRMNAQSKLEVFNTELENIKNNQAELNNTITEMKNTLEGINIKIHQAEELINELEDRVVEQNKEKRIKRNEYIERE